MVKYGTISSLWGPAYLNGWKLGPFSDSDFDIAVLLYRELLVWLDYLYPGGKIYCNVIFTYSTKCMLINGYIHTYHSSDLERVFSPSQPQRFPQKKKKSKKRNKWKKEKVKKKKKEIGFLSCLIDSGFVKVIIVSIKWYLIVIQSNESVHPIYNKYVIPRHSKGATVHSTELYTCWTKSKSVPWEFQSETTFLQGYLQQWLHNVTSIISCLIFHIPMYVLYIHPSIISSFNSLSQLLPSSLPLAPTLLQLSPFHLFPHHCFYINLNTSRLKSHFFFLALRRPPPLPPSINHALPPLPSLAQIPLLLHHPILHNPYIFGTIQVLSSSIVLAILAFFFHYLAVEAYYIPWTFILVNLSLPLLLTFPRIHSSPPSSGSHPFLLGY